MTERARALPGVGGYNALIAGMASLVVLTALFPGRLFVLPPDAFLAAHTLLETAAIVMAMLVFGVTWHGRAQARPRAPLWIACALFAAAWLDFAHTLSYPGMPAFITPSGPDKAIAFWLASRLVVAATLCAVAFMPLSDADAGPGRWKGGGPAPVLAAYGLAVAAYIGLVLASPDILPPSYIAGQGLTGFRIAAEWLVIGLLAVAAWRFRRATGSAPHYHAPALYAAAVVSVLGELAFTRYLSTYDAFNLLGHLFKAVAYGLVYRAVFVTQVQAPYRALKLRSDELAAAHARFRDLVETVPDWLWEVDARGVYTYVSPRVTAMLGYAPEELIGRTPFDFMPEAEARRMRFTFEAIARQRIPFHGLENVNLRRDGGEVVLETSGVPILGEEGELLGYRGSDRDITERMRGEQALESERVHMRTLVNTIPDLIWLKDPEGVYLACNPTFERFFGAREADILGKTDYDYIDVALADAFRANDAKAIAAGGPSVNEEWVSFADDGRRALLQTIKTPMYDGYGNLIGVLGVARDITALRAAEAALRRSEENLNRAQALAHIGSWHLELPGNVLTWSDENYRIFGLPVGTPLTYPLFLERVHPDDRALVDAAWQACLAGEPYDIEHRLLLGNSVRWVRERADLLSGPDGSQVGAIGTSQDITERKLAELEREKLEGQLRQAQKMEALGQLTGGIAHDFNNMLASIMGYTNLALARHVPDKEGKLAEYLGHVVAASERARDLIAKLLAYSRVPPNDQAVPLAPAALVTEAVHMLAATIPSSIELVTRVDAATPSVRIQPVDLQQVLVNLAVNARDAIGELGRIEITLGRATEVGGICALCQQPVSGDFVALEVIDTGAGIGADNLGRIFDPFFTTKASGKGSGLGLSMVQGIVKKVGGHVLVHSRPGHGSVFRVLLPVADGEAVVAAAPAAAGAPAATRGQRVWVVDDEPTVADFYRELLEAHGYQVRVFNRPADALQAFTGDPQALDLALLDQTMPGMTGGELARAMLGRRADLPLILCTGYSDHMDAGRAGELGLRRFFHKPVDSRQLLAALAEELASAARTA
jgi:PAS domain S-box-containing protein